MSEKPAEEELTRLSLEVAAEIYRGEFDSEEEIVRETAISHFIKIWDLSKDEATTILNDILIQNQIFSLNEGESQLNVPLLFNCEREYVGMVGVHFFEINPDESNEQIYERLKKERYIRKSKIQE